VHHRTNHLIYYPSLFPSIPLCTLINQHLAELARKFPQAKFLKSISTTCIPNYPDRNLPTVFVYHEGEMKAQFIGPLVFGGMNLKADGRTRESESVSVSESESALLILKIIRKYLK
jgi:hypothetical protein